MSRSQPSAFASLGAATSNGVLQEWHRLQRERAAEVILPCNGSEAWAAAMVAHRPFRTLPELFDASDQIWQGLDSAAWQQAFDSHPRIGERKAVAATAQSLRLSEGEQSGVLLDEEAKGALASANQAYEARFGRIFIVCATGKSAAQMLADLRARMVHSSGLELQVAAEEQRKITQLRLRKWLGVPAEARA